jgi:hypothetical protein
MAFTAPIDHRNLFKSSMADNMQQESGMSAGDFIPNSTRAAKPVGQAPQIKMKVNPRITKGLIRHSLSQALLK